jgi:PBP1b-binding outer membrane lipoprotein LpoB
MRRAVIFILLCTLILAGCSAPQNNDAQISAVTEEYVRDAITELISGINEGNLDVVQKYVGEAGPVAEKLVAALKDNIKIYNIRDVSIQGTTASAIVTLEVVPLKIEKDVTLNFDVTDVLILNNPLGLLSLLVR